MYIFFFKKKGMNEDEVKKEAKLGLKSKNLAPSK